MAQKEKKGVRLEHISKIYNDPKTGKEFYAVNDEHVCLSITDPKAIPNAKKDLEDLLCTPTPPTYTSDPYVAAKDADAILLVTDWSEYPALDWTKLYKSMRKPALVFDTRKCLDADKLRKIGFTVLNIGK